MYARLKLLWLSHLIEQHSLLSSQVVMICATSAVQALQLSRKMFPCQSSGSNATRCADSSMNVSGFPIALQQAEAFSDKILEQLPAGVQLPLQEKAGCVSVTHL